MFNEEVNFTIRVMIKEWYPRRAVKLGMRYHMESKFRRSTSVVTLWNVASCLDTSGYVEPG